MDEEADLALLDQHLLKTNLLSQRMTNILGQLDTRLSRLDKTIAPLGLGPLTKKDTNIELILQALNGNGNGNGNSSQSSSSNKPSSSIPPLRPLRSIPVPSFNSDSNPSPTIQTTGLGSLPKNNGILSPISSPSISKPSPVSGPSIKGFSLGTPLGNPLPSHLRTRTNDLSPIQSAAPSTTASPADETALLTRGPDIMSLSEYNTAFDGVVTDLERMYKGLMEGRGGAREAGVKDLASSPFFHWDSALVEIGFSGMTQLFLKISKDGMGKTIDAEALLNSGPPTPPTLFPPINTLLPLTSKINSTLYPRNPTPKTLSIVQPIWEQTISSFAEMRGDWFCRCLSGLVSRVEEIDEGGIWSEGRGRDKVRGLVGLWESLLNLAEAETLLITTLFPTPPPTLLLQTLSSPTQLLTSTLQPTLNSIKKSLSSQIFTALDLYTSLTKTQISWDQGLTKCFQMTYTPSSPETKDNLSILNQPISTLRSLSLRSFPELLVDIRTTQIDGPPTSSISETTHSTLNYLETLPQYENVVEGLLGKSHSERSWLMGQKDPPSPARNANEEGGTVNLFVADVLGTLLIHLDAKSTSMRKPIGQAFLLNNLSHIRNTTSSFNSDIIGPGAEDMLNKAFRDAKSQYLTEFHLLVNLLTTTHSTPRFGVPVPQGERHHLKESANQFFEKLAELENIVLQYPLNRQDPDMRDRISREAENIIRGGYDAFWGRCAGKGIEKYLRGSPDDVTRRVQAMFR
ncbi:uncharacterized protein IL334_003865 [Kwoniella shivajii]|uniref:Exocyst complex protein EXO70 n=1 Tax=Kwoniella shivajii TaxID=564305 RepID=A0ABZ1CZ55_9TREE|nr:hypothetical protein IL334_003865 [Kwoniella shivajii]